MTRRASTRRANPQGRRRIVCIGSIPLSILVQLDPTSRVIPLPDLESGLSFLRTAAAGARLLVNLGGLAGAIGAVYETGDGTDRGTAGDGA